jgi:hypothetical protein
MPAIAICDIHAEYSIQTKYLDGKNICNGRN